MRPITAAVRLFRHPLPPVARTTLAGHLVRVGRHKRLTTFRTSNRIREDSAYPPVVHRLRVLTNQHHNRLLPVLGRACQTLWPSLVNDGSAAVHLR